MGFPKNFPKPPPPPLLKISDIQGVFENIGFYPEEIFVNNNNNNKISADIQGGQKKIADIQGNRLLKKGISSPGGKDFFSGKAQ